MTMINHHEHAGLKRVMASAIFVLAIGLLNACGPSSPYRQGHGFYSEHLSQAEVQAAAKAGKVTNLGQFSFEVSSCGNYTSGLADGNLVIPTLQEKLPELGADAAENVLATERVGYFLLKLLVFGMGCSDWTISGDALLVDQRDGGARRNQR
jgi:hypothetical protein